MIIIISIQYPPPARLSAWLVEIDRTCATSCQKFAPFPVVRDGNQLTHSLVDLKLWHPCLASVFMLCVCVSVLCLCPCFVSVSISSVCVRVLRLYPCFVSLCKVCSHCKSTFADVCIVYHCTTFHIVWTHIPCWKLPTSWPTYRDVKHCHLWREVCANK